MMKTINLHIQKAQETPSRRNMKKTTLRHIIIKLLKTIDRKKPTKIRQRKRHMPYKIRTKMTANFLLETMQARRQ